MSAAIPSDQWYSAHSKFSALRDRDFSTGLCLTAAEWVVAKAAFKAARARINPRGVSYNGCAGQVAKEQHAMQFRIMHPEICRGDQAWTNNVTPLLMNKFGRKAPSAGQPMDVGNALNEDDDDDDDDDGSLGSHDSEDGLDYFEPEDGVHSTETQEQNPSMPTQEQNPSTLHPTQSNLSEETLQILVQLGRLHEPMSSGFTLKGTTVDIKICAAEVPGLETHGNQNIPTQDLYTMPGNLSAGALQVLVALGRLHDPTVGDSTTDSTAPSSEVSASKASDTETGHASKSGKDEQEDHVVDMIEVDTMQE